MVNIPTEFRSHITLNISSGIRDSILIQIVNFYFPSEQLLGNQILKELKDDVVCLALVAGPLKGGGMLILCVITFFVKLWNLP